MRVKCTSVFIVIVVVSYLTLACAAQSASGIPHLQKQGSATQLIVDGKPYLAMAGE